MPPKEQADRYPTGLSSVRRMEVHFVKTSIFGTSLWLWPHAVLVCGSFLTCLNILAADLQGAEQAEILERAILANRLPPSFSTHLDVQVEFAAQGDAANAVSGEVYSVDMRVDQDRIDVAYVSWEMRGGKKTPAYRKRGIWDGEQYLFRQQYLGEKAKPINVLTSADAHQGKRLLLNYSSAAFLYGIAAGDARPMLQIVKDSGDAVVTGLTQNVAGHPCHLIEARTEAGHYRVWVDPAAGFCIRKAVVNRGVGDILYGQSLPDQVGDVPRTQFETTISKVMIEQRGEHFVPVAADEVSVSRLKDGREMRTRVIAKRSDFQREPDFERLGAFKMDGIPNGTPVSPVKRTDFLTYMWRDGRVVVDTEEAVTKLTDEAIDAERRDARPNDAGRKP